MDTIGKELVPKIQGSVQGQELHVNFDNLDFKILANHVLTNHHNKDVHCINQSVTLDRVPSTHLDDSKPMADLKELPITSFLRSQEERRQFRGALITLTSRILTKHVTYLGQMKDVVCKHIPHPYSKQMAKKSVIIGLPVQPFNRSKHSDIIQYLDYIGGLLAEIYTPEDHQLNQKNESTEEKQARMDRILNSVKVPLGGDQLGRVIQGQRNYAWDVTVLQPELWHTKQSFLGVS